MGIEITETGLRCDYKVCKNGIMSFYSTREGLEKEGWGVAASSSDISKWKVYCPEHRWILKLFRDVLKEGSKPTQRTATRTA